MGPKQMKTTPARRASVAPPKSEIADSKKALANVKQRLRRSTIALEARGFNENESEAMVSRTTSSRRNQRSISRSSERGISTARSDNANALPTSSGRKASLVNHGLIFNELLYIHICTRNQIHLIFLPFVNLVTLYREFGHWVYSTGTKERI